MSKPSFLNTHDTRLQRINIQFQFLRFAFSHLSKAKRHLFFRTKREDMKRRILELNESLMDTDLGPTVKFLAGRVAKHHFGSEQLKLHENELFEDNLNRSELLVVIANFEVFLKQFYEQLLFANPVILARLSPDRSERWADIFSKKHSEFLKGAINREVKAFDREDIEKRIRTLEKHFRLSINPIQNADLKELFKLRNQISHESPDKVIPKELMERGRAIFEFLPSRLLIQAQKLFSHHFKT